MLNKLAKKWYSESENPEQIIEKAKNFFKNENFFYTYNPGKMDKSYPYDDFLFNKKAGFCEHFASSFSLLMRAANIPSRVIVGYQGGEVMKNIKNEEYLLIDNSYAHAWSEVWIKNKGWIRIDPTEWIAPERINSSNYINRDKISYLDIINMLIMEPKKMITHTHTCIHTYIP